jgi:hypothetical protein
LVKSKPTQKLAKHSSTIPLHVTPPLPAPRMRISSHSCLEPLIPFNRYSKSTSLEKKTLLWVMGDTNSNNKKLCSSLCGWNTAIEKKNNGRTPKTQKSTEKTILEEIAIHFLQSSKKMAEIRYTVIIPSPCPFSKSVLLSVFRKCHKLQVSADPLST